jgi:hypothetical protein
MQRRAMSDLRAETERSRRTRAVPRVVGSTEGPMGGGLPAGLGDINAGRASVIRGPKATGASRAAEARMGAQNPNVTPGSLEEVSPEERRVVRNAALSRRVSGTRRRSGGGSTPDLNTVAVGDTSVERAKTSAARSRARTAPGKSPVNPAAAPVARQLTTEARKRAASDFEKSAVRKAEAIEAGATNVKPAQLAAVTPIHPTQVVGTKEYHLARVSEAIGHEPEHIASFLRSNGLSVEQGAKGLYDLVHRETKGQEVVTKGSEAKGTLRQEPKKKAVTVVNRGGKTFYEKGTGNGTPALEALKQKVTEHVESSTASKRKAGTDVADAMVKAADATATMPKSLRGVPGIN